MINLLELLIEIRFRFIYCQFIAYISAENMEASFGSKHILIECTKLNHTRKRFYKVNSMKELFLKIALKNIINFLKTIGLLLKI